MLRLSCLIALLAALPVAAQDVWTSVPSGTTQDLRAVHFPTAEVGYAAGAGGTVLRTVNGGLTWQDASPDSTNDLHGVHFFNVEIGVVVGDGGAIFRTLNAGVDWTPIASGVEVSLQSVSFSGNVGIAGGGSQTILRSTDAGASWTTVQTDFFGGGFPGAHMLDATHAYVAGTNSIFQPLVGVSDNAGASFDFTAFYLNSNEGNLRDIHFLDAMTGVAVGVTWEGAGAISRTVNGGVDWTTTLFAPSIEAVDFATSNRGYAVGLMAGMLRTIDGGQTWSPTPAIGSAELFDIDLPTPADGFAVGASGTILKGALATASAPGASDATLELNVGPNPANGNVAIRFSLPAGTEATMHVYDTLGRHVATVLSGNHGAGQHAVRLDTRRLGAGAYVVVLDALDRRAVARLIVTR